MALQHRMHSTAARRIVTAMASVALVAGGATGVAAAHDGEPGHQGSLTEQLSVYPGLATAVQQARTSLWTAMRAARDAYRTATAGVWAGVQQGTADERAALHAAHDVYEALEGDGTAEEAAARTALVTAMQNYRTAMSAARASYATQTEAARAAAKSSMTAARATYVTAVTTAFATYAKGVEVPARLLAPGMGHRHHGQNH